MTASLSVPPLPRAVASAKESWESLLPSLLVQFSEISQSSLLWARSHTGLGIDWRVEKTWFLFLGGFSPIVFCPCRLALLLGAVFEGPYSGFYAQVSIQEMSFEGVRKKGVDLTEANTACSHKNIFPLCAPLRISSLRQPLYSCTFLDWWALIMY